MGGIKVYSKNQGVNAIHDYERRLNRYINFFKKEKSSNAKKILEFQDWHKLTGVSIATQLKYMEKLKRIYPWFKVEFMAVEKSDMKKLVRKKILEEATFGDETKKATMVTIKKFYKWLYNEDRDDLEEDEDEDEDKYPKVVSWIRPGKYMKQKKTLKRVEDMLDSDDIYKMVEVAEHPRDKAFVMMHAESGCRIGEVLTLQIKNLTFDEWGCVFMVDGKTGMRRVRVVNAVPFLNAWLQIHPDKDNTDAPLWVVIGTTKKISKEEKKYKFNWSYNLTYPASRELLKRLAKKAGITKPVNPHNFRHSRATLLGAKGLTESQMNSVMGWAQGSKMAGTYLHISGKQSDESLLKNVYGKKIEELNKEVKDKLNIIKCISCGHDNPFGSDRCIKCNSLIGDAIASWRKDTEVDVMKKQIDDIGKFMQLMAVDRLWHPSKKPAPHNLFQIEKNIYKNNKEFDDMMEGLKETKGVKNPKVVISENDEEVEE